MVQNFGVASFFCLGGALLASLYLGSFWPLIITVVALAICWHVLYGDSGGPRGSGHRHGWRCPRCHRWKR